MSYAVETMGLTKRFSRQNSYMSLLRFRRQLDLTAVDAVDLQVRAGELFGLLGPNGAGKTTLVKVLCTLILPTAGRALVCGKDVVTEAAAVRASIGLVDCQERSFFWRLSGWQNLSFFAALAGLRGREGERRMDELLDRVGLSQHAHRRFMDYSAGMRQRLAIARGLLAYPQVILMDEPTRSLDPIVARDLRRFIRQVLVDQMGHTVVLVTHHLEEAEALCDRIAIMDHGRVVACGSVQEIKKHIPTTVRYQIRVHGDLDGALVALSALPGVLALQHQTAALQTAELELLLVDEERTLPAVIDCIAAAGGRIGHCQVQELSLEEAFVHLVEEGAHGV